MHLHCSNFFALLKISKCVFILQSRIDHTSNHTCAPANRDQFYHSFTKDCTLRVNEDIFGHVLIVFSVTEHCLVICPQGFLSPCCDDQKG